MIGNSGDISSSILLTKGLQTVPHRLICNKYMKTKHEQTRLEKALDQFVTTMNGQTFTNNGDYTRILKSVAKEYFDYAFEVGYSRGCEETHKEHVDSIEKTFTEKY